MLEDEDASPRELDDSLTDLGGIYLKDKFFAEDPLKRLTLKFVENDLWSNDEIEHKFAVAYARDSHVVALAALAIAAVSVISAAVIDGGVMASMLAVVFVCCVVVMGTGIAMFVRQFPSRGPQATCAVVTLAAGCMYSLNFVAKLGPHFPSSLFLSLNFLSVVLHLQHMYAVGIAVVCSVVFIVFVSCCEASENARAVSVGWMAVGILTFLSGAYSSERYARISFIKELFSRNEFSVRMRSAEAELRAREAEAASLAKSQFLSNMSHEMRTPLTGAMGYAEILASIPYLTNEQRGYAENITTCGKVLMSLVEDVLDLEKMEAGSLKLSIAPFNLRDWLDDTMAVVATSATKKGIELVSYMPATSPCVFYADAARLRQICINLIGNAIKYTEQGEILVHVSLDDDPLDAEGTLVTVSVLDTGVGIPAAKFETLFDRFSQVNPVASRKVGGVGLGLAICKNLVDAMEGKIGVKSKVGGGSKFWVACTFPRGEKDPEESDEEDLSVHLGGCTFCIVSDRQSKNFVSTLMLYIQELGGTAIQSVLEHGELRTDQSFPARLSGYLVDNTVAKEFLRIRKELRVAACALMKSAGAAVSVPAAEFDLSMQKPLSLSGLLDNLSALSTCRPAWGRKAKTWSRYYKSTKSNKSEKTANVETPANTSSEPERNAKPPVFPPEVEDVVKPEREHAANHEEASLRESSTDTDNADSANMGETLISVASSVDMAVPAPRKLRARGDPLILLVDDIASVRDVAVLLIRSAGYSNVDTCTNGMEAVKYMERAIKERNIPDLIFMDCQMPILDGYEATHRIRALEEEKGCMQTPVVGLTANATQQCKEQCMKCGMSGFLTKPYTRVTMKDAIVLYIAGEDKTFAEEAKQLKSSTEEERIMQFMTIKRKRGGKSGKTGKSGKSGKGGKAKKKTTGGGKGTEL